MDKQQKRRELIEDIDLDRNDLEAALANAGQLWNQFGTWTAVTVLVAALAFMSWRFYGTWTESARQNGLTELAVETTPAGFGRIAEDYRNPAVRARALLAGGDTALAEAVRLDPEAEADAREGVLAEADALYRRALDASPGDVYAVNARLGLAAVAESRGEWDAAREHYEAAEQAAGTTLAYLGDVAAMRAEMLDEVRRPITFTAAVEADAVEPALPGVGLPGLDTPALDTPVFDDGGAMDGGLNFDALPLDDASGFTLPGLTDEPTILDDAEPAPEPGP